MFKFSQSKKKNLLKSTHKDNNENKLQKSNYWYLHVFIYKHHHRKAIHALTCTKNMIFFYNLAKKTVYLQIKN